MGKTVQGFFGGGVPLPGAVENRAVINEANFDVWLSAEIFSQHAAGIRPVLCLVDGDTGDIAVFPDIFRKIADENQFGNGGKFTETVGGHFVIGRDGDHSVRLLNPDALELHVLKICIKVCIHDGDDVDAILFQLVPDSFLMQLRPGGAGVMERNRDPVMSVPQLFFSSGDRIISDGETAFSP